MILSYAVTFALGCFAVAALLNLWMILRTPKVQDKILALDTLAVNGLALIVLYGVQVRTSMYFEAAILIAMTGFISTVALARFHLRGNLIE